MLFLVPGIRDLKVKVCRWHCPLVMFLNSKEMCVRFELNCSIPEPPVPDTGPLSLGGSVYLWYLLWLSVECIGDIEG